MKSVILVFICLIVTFPAFCQEEDGYYRAPSQRQDIKNNVYPNLERKSVNLYLGVEGGLELNRSTLSNNMDGLIGKEKGNDLYWGVVLGYNMNHVWSIETGYYKNPTHLIQSVRSGRSIPYIYKMGSGLNTIPIRFKRRVFTIDPITKNATIHVGAGVLLSPDAQNKPIDNRGFAGLSNNAPGQKPDTLRLKSDAFLSKKAVAQAELLLELHGRVSETLSIVVFARGNIGAKGMVRSEINYSINKQTIDTAQQLTNGISFNFGLVLRYNILRGYKYIDKNDDE
ncbi:hypothetical protein [Emticicia sp. 21SJ11W-3]|uniref:hypothetical protein n=1 Tax=Emticicia sp. 21SJ11W-3 TaxID=2916755 RepID=UPI00209C759F|nr:hypothetical protein [Emticicia sp. 21SJ11W-3]UTA69013.1 hypothetical protein MB380_04215 [Emticicia sp. 21SJ11W-3]